MLSNSWLLCAPRSPLQKPDFAHWREPTWPGLKEVCEAVGMPPVLGMGACVDNSRILAACSEMVRVGGLGESIAELPVAGAAPEWYSEKAITIGHYSVASGVFTVFGVTYPIIKETKFYRLLFDGLEKQGLGKWAFTVSAQNLKEGHGCLFCYALQTGRLAMSFQNGL